MGHGRLIARGRKTTAVVAVAPQAPPQLGDELKAMLDSHGITPEWYRELKQKIGLPPSCSCPERQAWINQATEALPEGVRHASTRVLRWLSRSN